MLDFGESRTLVLEAERVKREKRLDGLWIDSWREEASTLCCRRAEEGEGVRGVRPPAKRVEKMPSRRLMGVITERVAISVIVVVSVCPWWWFVEMFLPGCRWSFDWFAVDDSMKSSVSSSGQIYCSKSRLGEKIIVLGERGFARAR